MMPDRRSIGVVAAGFATFINLYATQAILAVLAAEFRVSLPRTGWTVTAPLLAVAMVAPFVGSISDRLGRKRLIVGAAALLVVPTVLIAAARSLEMLVVLRFLQGLLLPFVFAITVGYIGDECDGPDVIRLTATYALGTIVGGFCGRFILGHATEIAGWRAGFLLLGALTAIGASVIALALPRERRFRPQHGFVVFGTFAEHLSNPRLIATYAVGFAVLFSIVVAFTYANFVLAAPPWRFGPAALGNVFVVYLLAIVTTPAATRMAVRLGLRATLAVACGLGILGMLLTLLPSAIGIVAGLGLAIGGMFIEQVLATGFIGVAARHARSTAVGLYVTFYYVGGSLGGVLPAGVWHRAGWPGCVALVIAVQSVMLAIALAFWQEPKEQEKR